MALACFTTYEALNAMKPGLRGVLGEAYLNISTDDSDTETNFLNVTFNEAIELVSMKDDIPDQFILSNLSIGWKASKGLGGWSANEFYFRMMTRVDPDDLGLNATRFKNYYM